MEYYGIVFKSEFLSHHGIKGMKWGVRRYQNPDGSYTAAGRSRYGFGDGKQYKPGDAGKVKKKKGIYDTLPDDELDYDYVSSDIDPDDYEDRYKYSKKDHRMADDTHRYVQEIRSKYWTTQDAKNVVDQINEQLKIASRKQPRWSKSDENPYSKLGEIEKTAAKKRAEEEARQILSKKGRSGLINYIRYYSGDEDISIDKALSKRPEQWTDQELIKFYTMTHSARIIQDIERHL